MTVRNVGIVFAPTLNIPAPVFSMFLTDYDSIFGDADPNSTKPATELTVENSLLPNDIRSPRHQMFSDIPTPSYQQTSFRHTGDTNSAADGPRPPYDTGFIPMQPSYDQATSSRHEQYNQPPDNSAGYSSLNGMLGPSSEDTRSAKTKRRESSMLFMDGKIPIERTTSITFANHDLQILLSIRVTEFQFSSGPFFFALLFLNLAIATFARKNYDLHDCRMMTSLTW